LENQQEHHKEVAIEDKKEARSQTVNFIDCQRSDERQMLK